MSRRREKRRIAEGGLPPGAVAADVSKQVPINSLAGGVQWGWGRPAQRLERAWKQMKI